MSAAITAAAVGTAGAVYSARQASKGASGASRSSRSPWLEDAGRNALSRADQIANRRYTAFTGNRVAGLSSNEQQAGRLAKTFGDQTRANMRTGFQAGDLEQFRNPYLEQVLGNQRRVIDAEYGRQTGALSANQAARDAFRSGRSDLARARLDTGRMRALGDAEATGQAAAFDVAMNNYFANQANQRANLDASVGALNLTGAADRSVRQAQADFDYSQYLEKRDWDVSNLQPLLAALQAAQGASGSLTTTSGPRNSPWGAAAGLLSTAIGQYGKYRGGQQMSAGTNRASPDYWAGSGLNFGAFAQDVYSPQYRDGPVNTGVWSGGNSPGLVDSPALGGSVDSYEDIGGGDVQYA